MSSRHPGASGRRLILISFALGALFAIGLGISGMTMPQKIVGYLDFFGDWDPSLIFVMGGAVPVFALAFRASGRRMGPAFGGAFRIPTRRDIDTRLLAGAAIFGLGWGLGGFCPGPALSSAALGSAEVWVFLAAMLAGMQLANLYDAASERRRKRAAEPALEEPAAAGPGHMAGSMSATLS